MPVKVYTDTGCDSNNFLFSCDSVEECNKKGASYAIQTVSVDSEAKCFDSIVKFEQNHVTSITCPAGQTYNTNFNGTTLTDMMLNACH